MDHTIVHFEIPANDVQKLKTFYGGLFGWDMNKYPGPGDYYLVETVPVDDNMTPTRAGVNGALFQKSPQMDVTQPTNYFGVESVDEYSKKAVELGGKVVIPKMEIQGIGWWALVVDPEGNRFGILEYMKK